MGQSAETDDTVNVSSLLTVKQDIHNLVLLQGGQKQIRLFTWTCGHAVKQTHDFGANGVQTTQIL